MVVRMRHTRSHTGNRRSHHKVGRATLSTESGTVRLRHRASLVTGTYRGRSVLDVVKKVEKKQAKNKARV